MPVPDLSDVDGDVYVTPRYLAGSSGVGDVGFAPVAHWPHHHLDEGPYQLVVTSPDHRIRIGWAGDDYYLWTITAAPDAVSAHWWSVTANHNTPAELVGALTAALAEDWAPDQDRFLSALAGWSNSLTLLADAGWQLRHAGPGVIGALAPGGQAGAVADLRRHGAQDEVFTLWAGPEGWATQAEITFTANTPSHLLLAVAKAFTDPAPVARWRETLHPALAARAQLTPITPPRPAVPTPRDVRPRIAVRHPVAIGSVPRWSTSTPSALLPARAAARR
ncbi:DUF317 domain-containing protein [Streptomyces cinereoruber]|uniref:DUF317 domain-containing protein n=1 Tax=Streptomyces cinereoruber TaxID=67260 RepID=UPI00369A7F46